MPLFRNKPERSLPLEGMVLQQVEFFDTYDVQTGRYETKNVDEAKVITSMIDESFATHKVVLDIDLPAQLIPSSTPGHFHLYIDKEIPAHRYFQLLKALSAAGVIESGYAEASLERGFTAVRLPWIKKETS